MFSRPVSWGGIGSVWGRRQRVSENVPLSGHVSRPLRQTQREMTQ